jgi:hypothetical protein
MDVEDKWTLLPILRYAQIAGSTSITVGVWDSNFVGKAVNTGFELSEKRGGTGVYLWAKNNRIGASRFYYSVEGWFARDDRLLYGESPRDVISTGYEEFRRSVALEFGRRFNNDGDILVGVVARPFASSFEAITVDGAQNAAARYQPIADRRGGAVGLHGTAGKLHYQDYVYAGLKADVSGLEYFQQTGAPRRYGKFLADVRWMTVPVARHNFAVRLVAATVGSRQIEDAVSLGGLTEVRGFPDDRFRGRQAAYLNVEYRYPVIDNRYLLMQLTPFQDAAVWSGRFVGQSTHGAAESLGAGARFVVKPFYNLIVRLDAVERMTPGRETTFSLGSTQFF